MQDHAPLNQGLASKGDLVLASVNAGNTPSLQVGLGGVKGAFAKVLAQTATNTIAAVAVFNATASQGGIPPVEAARLCLYSSGYYRKKSVDMANVAKAIYKGARQGLIDSDLDLAEIQMPVGHRGV
ncbi:hypothetical protein J4E08_08630 [Sagittula sp. NFXS13]|uniref:hypothetical protein n=1 Tax=Sagittula sp. NFXS13 TaxID=2819095 RepID=UPI0032DEF9D6